MYKMLKSLLITLIATCAFAQPSTRSIFKEDDVSKAISSLVYLLTDTTSSEDIEQRKIIHYVADDGQESIVVFFTIEGQGGGGNMYMHYVAVFTCLNFGVDRNGYRPSLVDYAHIGGKFWRELELDTARVSGKKQSIFIDVDTLEYKHTEGTTDRPRKSKAHFTVLSVLGADIQELPKFRKVKKQ